MKKDNWLTILQPISWLTQLGVSVALPIVAALLGASWLVRRGWGSWVYLAAMVLGLGTAACTFWEFLKMVQRKSGARRKGTNEDRK